MQLAERGIQLAEDPTGIAPERALVFEVAGSIQNFARAASRVGLEVIAEIDLEATDEFPEGFTPPAGTRTISPTLYATIPTIRAARQILTLWQAHQDGEAAPKGAAPWWRLFDLLLKLRTWGPEDRFPKGARAIIEQRLPADDDAEVNVEFEIWPSASGDMRARWRQETEAKLRALGGQIVDRSSIEDEGFVYEALLARLSAGVVRDLLRNPDAPAGLARARGIQFILPQTVGQAIPEPRCDLDEAIGAFEPADGEPPIRVALLDGVPVAAHPALDGAVLIEDVHDVVPLSLVANRAHATAMASLILRGDLKVDGAVLPKTRLVSVPVAIDIPGGGARSPADKLFVDMIHVALTKLFVGDDALAPDAFVVNLSMGVPEQRFGGRISSLARLIDWWASKHGVLFVISTGNITEDLVVSDCDRDRFINSGAARKRSLVQEALRTLGYGRCLTAPAEALNGLTVGALSSDLAAPEAVAEDANVVRLEMDGERYPAISSGLGLGPFRSVKPDLLESGGVHQVRPIAAGADVRLAVVRSKESGLVVADAARGIRRTIGTSCATALTTRAILQSALALTDDTGPYRGQQLSRRDLALLTRALAVHSAHWPDEAGALYQSELARFGRGRSLRAKEETARHFGHGVLNPARMQESPAGGVTLVGIDDIRKDQGKIFGVPLPRSLSGDRVPRSMRVTLAWFTPVNVARSRYRLASLEAIAADYLDGVDQDEDKGWGLLLKASGLDDKIIGRGTVWSRRLIHNRLACPVYREDQTVPVRVQCMDASGGGLSSDIDIRFAIAVTLEVEADVQYDIFEEVRTVVEPRVRGAV